MINVEVILSNLNKQITNYEAAYTCEISVSQFKRYKKRFLSEGKKGLLHKGIGNSNARKYNDFVQNHIVESYRAESAKIMEKTNNSRGPRKLRVFLRSYCIDNNICIPYTTGKKILNDNNIISPISKFQDLYATNIPLKNEANNVVSGFEFQADGSMGYKFPDDDFEVCAHAIVDASTSTLCANNFQKGECNKGYYNSFREAFVTVGIPKQVCTDGRTTFFNIKDSTNETSMGKILTSLGVKLITTRNCNRNNKVENSHDPIRDYIFDQMMIDGVRTYKEANDNMQYYIDRYNESLNHSITEDNVFRQEESLVIDNFFLIQTTRSMSKKYTISLNNIDYFIVRDNTLLQRKPRTKIKIYTTYNGEFFVLYGGNKYILVPATPDVLKTLKRREGSIEKVLVKKNAFNFKYKGQLMYAIDSIGNPVKLVHRDLVNLSIVNEEIEKVRTKKGIFKVALGNVDIKNKIILETRKISYKQTVIAFGKEYVLLDHKGNRYIDKIGTPVDLIIEDNRLISIIAKGKVYSAFDASIDKSKYIIPNSNFAARKMFRDMI